MKVNDVMTEEVFVIKESEQIGYARNLMLKHGFSRIIVVDQNNKPIGIVTEKDLSSKLRGSEPSWRRRPIDKISIRRVMSNKLITLASDRDLKDAVEIMIKNEISSVPITDEEGIAGIITKTDLMKFFSEKLVNKWKVSDLMSSDVITVNENHTINHVISIMEENRISRIIVIRDNEPIGIITPENITFADFNDPETGVSLEKIYFIRKTNGNEKKNVRLVSMLTAGDIMTNHLLNIEKNEDATKAAKMMYDNDISGVPVVEDGNLIGIITKTDIIKGIQ
jgi:CBS domain-containing protein